MSTPTPVSGDYPHLNVNPADLLNIADNYTELAARVSTISPQAADEIQRIIATHGPMGYPVAVGIAAGLVAQEGPVLAKGADFTQYAQRFTEHAATYQSQDTDGADQMNALTQGHNGNSTTYRGAERADYHGGGGVQMVDNRTPLPQEPSPPVPKPPYQVAPGGQPQVGPFPVPPELAQATPSLIRPIDPTGGLLTPPTVSTAPEGPPEILPGKPIPGIQAAGPPAPAPAPAPSPWRHPGCTDQQWRDAWLLYEGTGAGMGASLAFGPEAAIPAWVAGIPVEIAEGDQIIACTEPPPAHR